MPICSAYGCSESDRSKTSLHFYRFPSREKSPSRYKVWVDFCKRKYFTPTRNSRLCSKHFKFQDFNQSDIMKNKLMPDLKVRINLNPNVVPTIRSSTSSKTDNSLTLSERNKRVDRREFIQFTSELLTTSTPKKVKLIQNNVDLNLEVNDCSLQSEFSEERVGQNDIGIQCDIGLETYQKVEKNDDLSFDIPSESEDESSTSDIDSDDDSQHEYNRHDKSNLSTQNDFNDNSCFVVFWENLSQLFKYCRQCSSRVCSQQHFTQGALVSIITICEQGHIMQWCSQPKTGKRPEGNILITAALVLSGILFNQFKVFCSALKLSIFTRPVYDKIINKYLFPVICHQWEEHRKKNIEAIKLSPIWLAGDRQYDSPGFCAKYCTYLFSYGY